MPQYKAVFRSPMIGRPELEHHFHDANDDTAAAHTKRLIETCCDQFSHYDTVFLVRGRKSDDANVVCQFKFAQKTIIERMEETG